MSIMPSSAKARRTADRPGPSLADRTYGLGRRVNSIPNRSEFLGTLTRVRPEGDTDAWDALRNALRRELAR